jgi:hypothetical protein
LEDIQLLFSLATVTEGTALLFSAGERLRFQADARDCDQIPLSQNEFPIYKTFYLHARDPFEHPYV